MRKIPNQQDKPARRPMMQRVAPKGRPLRRGPNIKAIEQRELIFQGTLMQLKDIPCAFGSSEFQGSASSAQSRSGEGLSERKVFKVRKMFQP